VSSRVRLALSGAVAAAAIAIVLVAMLTQPGGRSASATTRTEGASGFAGAPLQAEAPAPNFTLSDQSGRRVSLAASRGRVTVLVFLSTSCAPACVLVAQQIRGALDELRRVPSVLFVSADPVADTPARVSSFLAAVSLTGRAHFLTGTSRTLAPIWRAYGVRPLSFGRGAFERSLEVRLIDRFGRERVLFGLEQLTPEGLAHDVRKLS
jgi:protein SCO1